MTLVTLFIVGGVITSWVGAGFIAGKRWGSIEARIKELERKIHDA